LNRATAQDAVLADGVTLRKMTAADLEMAYAMSTELRWPHRLEDWQLAFALGQGVVAERDGAVVATGLTWRWDRNFATLGLIIVAEACRGQRIGHRVMEALMAEAQPRRILLYATAEGRGLYERLGFVRIGEVRQHQGTALPAPLVALDPGWRLRPASHRDLDALIALDARARGMHRPALIATLVAEASHAVVLDHDSVAQGFALLRRFGRGWSIGPVTAPDALGAQALIAHLTGLNAGRFTRIDIDFDSGLAEWIETLGMRRVGTVTTMVFGEPPASDAGPRLFALATQAFG